MHHSKFKNSAEDHVSRRHLPHVCERFSLPELFSLFFIKEKGA